MTSDSSKQYIPRVAETINFPREEESILTLWKEIDAFRNCLKQSKGKPRYTFYDGPPFATGLPHYGHILAGSIKDVVTRYAHQQGFHVERRFGWDCHGLPVEFEIDKLLGIKGPDDVMKMGIGKYNEHCRKIVMRYSDEWETIMGRLGRWIDFKNDYKSMYPWYMETIWWIFKQLYDKGFVYQGNKVMPYSTACNTPLSNFESGQNYKDVVDPAVTISLPLLDDVEGAALLIWTTTPWTLPSNLAACVNPNLTYVRVKEISTGKLYIMLENRVETVLEQGNYEIIKQFPGRDLRNLRYEPIFPYFKSLGESHGAFRVLLDDYVTAESGTGVVHQAPYFGEDDYRVCLANGIITKDMDPICPVDASGRFVAPVHHFEGQYVKDADKNIMALLKTNNRLVIQSQMKHSYPFCWRSDTPLIYRAVPSWFIRVEHMQDQLQAVSSKTYWVPEFVRDKRFGNWLKDARDWAVSRNRYWGTPIPIWMSENGDEIRCIGSLEELCSLTGQTVTDIHRENIDHLEIPSRIPGNPPLRRVSEVFDCWFESGSMPYAQQHYPFENKKEFEDFFPADFVAEGIDQTRGWFYTLIVISTALFGEAPFKNLIANGMVLASDGQKMSKRKKNYPDPMEVVNKYGADALRLYLISSPVVRAENLRFKEEGVRDIIKDVFLPWYNAFRFLLQNIENYVEAGNSFYYKEADVSSTNVMDLWILSFTQSLLQYVLEEMAVYHLYNVVPRLTKFVDYLTNWYVRMNRKRLKGEGGKEDCKAALLTLFNVVLNITKMMAPFAPFLSETMYQHLKGLTDSPSDSIHFLMFPKPKTDLINMNIERAVSRMQSIIDLGRVLRDRKTIPIKYPLPEVIIIHQDPEYLSDIVSLKAYILSELNVRNLSTTRDKSKFGIKLRAEPDQKVLGLRLKNESKTVIAAIKVLTDDEINEMVKSGYRDIAGQRIDISEVRLILKCDSVSTSQYEVNSDNDVLILLDVTPDNSMQDEGVAREIINRVQKLRKKAHLVPTDEISVFYKTENDFARIAIEYTNFIEGTIKASFKPVTDRKTTDQLIIEEFITMKNGNLYLVLTKYCNVETPTVKWVNVLLLGFKSRFYESDKGLILLEAAKKALKLKELEAQVTSLFGVDKFALWGKNGKLTNNEHLTDLSGTTIVVCRPDVQPVIPENSAPFCKVSNFVEKGTKGTLVLENPKGNKVLGESDYAEVINFWTKGHE